MEKYFVMPLVEGNFIINKERGNWVIAKPDINPLSIPELRCKHEHKFLEDRLDMLILNTTNQCNLRCGYCSIGDKTRRKMDMDLGNKIIDRIKEFHPENMNILFHGAEPLLNYEFIKQFVHQSRLRLKDTKLRFSVQTNATLLDEGILRYFKENSIGVSFSLDGPQNINDRQRVYPNGDGTFIKIESNVDLLKQVQNHISVVTVVTNKNVRDLALIYDFFKKKDYDVVQFTLVHPLGYTKDNEMLPSNSEAFESMSRVFDKNIEDISNGSKFRVKNLKMILNNFFQTTRPLSCTSCGVNNLHPLAVDIDGSFYPCDFYWGRNNSSLGNIFYNSFLDAIRSKNNPRNTTTNSIGNLSKYPFFSFHTNGCPAVLNDGSEENPYLHYYENIYSYVASIIPMLHKKGLITKILDN